MSQTIKIKRSTNNASPTSLAQGELAYSDNSHKLFIGSATDGTVLAIGGKLYVDMLDHTAGTLTASSAIIVDADSKIDQLKTANLTINGNAITSGSGDIDLVAAGNLDIDAGTVTFDTQATEFKIIDNSTTALTISEANNNYITLDTTNTTEKIILNKQVTFGLDGTAGYTLPTADGSTGQALITNGSGAVAFTTISTILDIAADTNVESPNVTQVSLLTDTLSILGTSGQGVSTEADGTAITITVANATTTTKGVASFASADFDVSGAGAVSIKTGGVSNAQLAGSIENAKLVHSSITIGSDVISLGDSRTDLNGITSLDVDNLTLDGNDISSTDTNGNITLTPDGTGVVKVPSGYKDRANFDADTLVPKAYVDAVQQGLDVKESVRVATVTSAGDLGATYDNGTAGVGATLTGQESPQVALQIDGVSLNANDRVLVKDQTDAKQNGIYEVTTVGDGSTDWVLTRTNDADTPSDLSGGTFTFVEEGTANADNGYVFTHNGQPTIGTDNLTVSQFSGAGQITAGDGLTKSGNTINVVGSPTITANADSVQIKGISGTNAGDLIYGVATNGGFSTLSAPSLGAASSPATTVTASEYLLSIDLAGTPTWGNVLDGGTY